MLNKLTTLLFFLLLVTLLQGQVRADNMQSNSYSIQFGNFNILSGSEGSSSYNLTNTMGGLAVGPYGQYGSSSYFVGSGFQYVYQIDYFSFSISKLNIELGELFTGGFNTDSHTINITTNGASGYSVYAFESHPLRLVNALVDIPDTSCDAANCSETVAGLWTNASATGFGFNVSGDDVASDFLSANYFRQFANSATGESMQRIMGSNNVALNRTATVTYKATMPGNQAAGNYQTSIVFVAVPGY